MSTWSDPMASLNAACANWLREIARGDEQALTALYDATLGRCYALAYRITRNRQSAEDVLTTTFHQVWREAARYDPARGHPMAWLLTICRSRALDHLRQRDPAESHPEPDTLVRAGEEVEADDPLSTLIQRDTHARLHEAIAGLPRLSQQLLALAFFRGLSHQEIADHTGMPLGTVKTHLRQAQAALRAAIREDSETWRTSEHETHGPSRGMAGQERLDES